VNLCPHERPLGSCAGCCEHGRPYQVDCSTCQRDCVPHGIIHTDSECTQGWELVELSIQQAHQEQVQEELNAEAIDTQKHEVSATYGDAEKGEPLFQHLVYQSLEDVMDEKEPYLTMKPGDDPLLARAYLGIPGLELARRMGVEQQRVPQDVWQQTVPLALLSVVASTILHRSNWFSHWYTGEQVGRTPQELLRHPFCWDSEHGEPFSFFIHYVVVGQSGAGKTTPLTQTRVLLGSIIHSVEVTRTYVPGYFGYLIPRKGGEWQKVEGYLEQVQDGVVQFREGSLFPALIDSEPMALTNLMTYCETGYYESRTKASGWLRYFSASTNQVCLQSDKFTEVFGGDAAGLIRRFVVSVIPWSEEWKLDSKGQNYPPDPLALRCFQARLKWLREEFHPVGLDPNAVIQWTYAQSKAHPELHIGKDFVQRWVSLAAAYYVLNHQFPFPDHVILPEPDETLSRILLQEAADRLIAYQTTDDARMNRAAPVLLFAPASLVGTETSPVPFTRQALQEYIAKSLEMTNVEAVKHLFWGRERERVPYEGLMSRNEVMARSHETEVDEEGQHRGWDPPDEVSIVQRYRGPLRPYDPDGPGRKGRKSDLFIMNWKALRTYLASFPSGREALQRHLQQELSGVDGHDSSVGGESGAKA
jgi:hypothetical protein